MDLIELFKQFDIRVWRSGKNVSKGWIGLQCKFCNDDSNHLGIRLRDYKCKCWKCGGHSFLNTLITTLEISKEEAKKIIRNLGHSPQGRQQDEEGILYEDIDQGNIASLRLPQEATTRFPKLHNDYLLNRGFQPKKIIKEFGLRAIENLGKYKYRIIIPIINESKIVSFTSRDVTGFQEPKYLAASAKVYPNPKHYIYNLDSVPKGGDAVLVEGPADVWKLGQGAVSLMGIEYHAHQLLYLNRKKINRLNLFFDNDKPGKKAAKDLSRILVPFVRELNIITLDLPGVKDPGELSREEAEVLMDSLGFRKK